MASYNSVIWLNIDNITKWHDSLTDVKNFVSENNKLPSRYTSCKKESSLAHWIKRQRENYKNRKGIMKDVKYRNIWDKFIDSKNSTLNFKSMSWEEKLINVQKFITEHNRLPSRGRFCKTECGMAYWIKRQKKNYKNKARVMKDVKYRDIWKKFIDTNSSILNFKNLSWEKKLNEYEKFIKDTQLKPAEKSSDNVERTLSYWFKNTMQRTKKSKSKWRRGKLINMCSKYSDHFKIQDNGTIKRINGQLYRNIYKWCENFIKYIDFLKTNDRKPVFSVKHERSMAMWYKKQFNMYRRCVNIFCNKKIKEMFQKFLSQYQCVLKKRPVVFSEERILSAFNRWESKLNDVIKYIEKNKMFPRKKKCESSKYDWIDSNTRKYKKKESFFKYDIFYNKFTQFLEKYGHYSASNHSERSKDIWIERLDELINYLDNSGELLSSEHSDSYNRDCYHWITNKFLQYQIKKGVLSDPVVRSKFKYITEKHGNIFTKSVEVNFIKSSKEKWFYNFNKINEYIETYGFKMSLKDPKIYKLYRWFYRQCKNYNNNIRMFKHDDIRDAFKKFIEDYTLEDIVKKFSNNAEKNTTLDKFKNITENIDTIKSDTSKKTFIKNTINKYNNKTRFFKEQDARDIIYEICKKLPYYFKIKDDTIETINEHLNGIKTWNEKLMDAQRHIKEACNNRKKLIHNSSTTKWIFKQIGYYNKKNATLSKENPEKRRNFLLLCKCWKNIFTYIESIDCIRLEYKY